MIEVVAANGRVWITINNQRVGFLPEQAKDLAKAMLDACTSITGSGVIEEGEFIAGEV